MNWRQDDLSTQNINEQTSSLAFFSARGHRQILAGYYDAPSAPEQARKEAETARKTPGVMGLMYKSE